MICQNCQNVVADDLVFCTECGTRLHETVLNAQTVIMPESVVTKVTQPIEKPKSSLRWIALVIGIVAAIAIPASLIIAYVAFNNPNKPNANKEVAKTPVSSNRKSGNQNKPANAAINNANNLNVNSNSQTNTESQNTNAKVALQSREIKILDEQINVDEHNHIAFPFKVAEDNTKIIGEVEILNGEQFDGLVFLQEMYDEHSVDPTYKMFSFDSNQGKSAKIEQVLTKGNYVLVFANNDGQGVSVKAKFTQIPPTIP